MELEAGVRLAELLSNGVGLGGGKPLESKQRADGAFASESVWSRKAMIAAALAEELTSVTGLAPDITCTAPVLERESEL